MTAKVSRFAAQSQELESESPPGPHERPSAVGPRDSAVAAGRGHCNGRASVEDELLDVAMYEQRANEPMASAHNRGKVSRYGAHDDADDDCPCRECRHRRMAEQANRDADSALRAVGFWLLIGALITILGLAIKALA